MNPGEMSARSAWQRVRSVAAAAAATVALLLVGRAANAGAATQATPAADGPTDRIAPQPADHVAYIDPNSLGEGWGDWPKPRPE